MMLRQPTTDILQCNAALSRPQLGPRMSELRLDASISQQGTLRR